MKVLFVTPYLYSEELPGFQRNRTGFGILLEQMVEHIGSRCELSVFSNVITPEARCHEARVLSHTWSDVFRSAGCKGALAGAGAFFRASGPLSARLRTGYYRMNCAALRRAIAEWRPDLIHCHGIGTDMRRYYDVCRESGVPTVMTLHGLIAQLSQVSKADAMSEITFLREADAAHWPVSLISSGIKKRLYREPYSLTDGASIAVILNGVAMHPAADLPGLREEYGLSADALLCVCAGSVCDRKNQAQLVRAYELLPAEIRGRLHILLAGPIDESYPIREEIARLTAPSHVHLLGFVPQPKLLSLYRIADITVLPSKDEGFGLSLAESFVQGTPCVTFADLDAAEDLYDPCAMLLCHERSDEALSAAMAQALEAVWDHDAIRRHGRKFSLDAMADRYLAWYQDCVGEQKC